MANPTGRGGFTIGNPGGPGRPPRSVEKSYLTATIASVSLAAWRRIVIRARQQAEDGDARAREWLSKLLVGSDPLPLAQLIAELQEELHRLKELPHVHNGQVNGEALAH
jgi:hypothetical protein